MTCQVIIEGRSFMLELESRSGLSGDQDGSKVRSRLVSSWSGLIKVDI